MFLIVVAYLNICTKLYIARVGRQNSVYYFKQGGLAGAVAAYDGNSFSSFYFKIYIFKLNFLEGLC